MAGLLADVYSFGNRTRNRLRGLLDDPVGYLQQTADQAANTLKDMAGANEIAQQFALRDQIKAGDKNALAQYRDLDKTIKNKLFDVALNFNPAAVGMFIGKGAKTWDAAAAAEAEKRLAAGDDARKVWSDLGVFRGPDGHLRQEIPDNVAQLEHPMPNVVELNKQARQAKTLEEAKQIGDEYNKWMTWANQSPAMRSMSVVEQGGDGGLIHPSLKQSYPGTASEGGLPRIWWENIGSVKGGEFDEGANRVRIAMGHYADTDQSKSVALHELQHAIQRREGWAKGGSPDSPYQAGERTRLINEDAARRMVPIAKENPYSAGAYVPSEEEALQMAIAYVDSKAGREAAYRRLAGEAEARATQARMNMDMAQRRATFPLDSYDVPVNQLIIRGGLLK